MTRTIVSEEDRLAIIAAVGTFRMGAPIVADDVRLACAVDGHPIRHVPANSLPSILKIRCDTRTDTNGEHCAYVRRW